MESPSISQSIEITPRAKSQIERGSFWVFSNEIRMETAKAVPGQWCWFVCRGETVATGYFNPHSLIAGRVVARGKTDDVVKLLESRISTALTRRAPIGGDKALRLIYSEGDTLPGLIVDWYAGHVALQSNTAGMDTALPVVQNILVDQIEKASHQKPLSLILRADAPSRSLEGLPLRTEKLLGEEGAGSHVVFQENGVRYIANLVEGQKTGFFLDQRTNRRFLTKFVQKQPVRNVLDLFCYSGGWGIAALKAGAAAVTFVDQSAEALERVKEALALNNISEDRARFVQSDVFDFLATETEVYDVVVSDPPAFVKSRKNYPKGVKAYEKLARLCWRRLCENGFLFLCSCSYHVSEEDFTEIVRNAVGKEGALAHLSYRGSQADDHPVLLSMPETRYLKCLGLRRLA